MFRSYRERGYEFVRKGQLPEAVKVYEAAYAEALRQGDKRTAAMFLNNVGAAKMGSLKMRDTMATLLQTRKLAEETGYTELVRLSTLNLAQLYLQMEDLPAAVEAANRGLEAMGVSELPVYRVQVLLQLAKVRSRQGNMDECEKLMLQAVDVAEASSETGPLGRIWNHLGYEYLQHGRLDKAEAALLHAYRVLSERNDPELMLCYPNLASLYRNKGDLKESARWMELAIRSSILGKRQLPGWYLYQERGRLHQAEGNQTLALEDFRRSLRDARLWRLDVVPASSLRVSSEVKLQSIYDAFLSAGYEVYRRRPSGALMAELFLAAEENRAWSLREALRGAAMQELSDEYYNLLAQLRAASSQPDIARLRNHLLELEAASGLQRESVDDGQLALQAIQENLEPDEAMLLFHMTGDQPMLWTLTGSGLTMHRLPPKMAVENAVSRFQVAVRQPGSDFPCAAQAAYQALLGQAPATVLAKRHWLLALDVGLFDMPFAALRSNGRFLVEDHILTVSPHPSLRRKRQLTQSVNSFLGVGDPIYNRADPRWREPRRMFGNMWTAGETDQLPRLPGAGREIERCGRAAAPAPRLLKGSDATLERFQAELSRQPGLIHLAAHVVQSAADPNQAAIAFSIHGDGTAALLSRETIASLRANARAVIMSGCGSGLGPVLPGAGLMGLTRAWLEAGADSVAASLWPVPDDSGELLTAFYQALKKEGESASGALRAAQLESLRSNSWRSNPHYWSAYFIAGKD